MRIIRSILTLPTRMFNRFNLKRKHVKYGCDLQITGRLGLHGSGKIEIGDHVRIHSDPNVNPSACGVTAHLTAGSGGQLRIGNHVGMSHCAVTAMNSVVIEDHVLIGSNTMIADTDFHPVDAAARLAGSEGTRTAPVHICENAFIGARCIILKGVTIGKNAVVGAGSVVTRDIPENEIWGGNPAKLIRKQ